MNSAIQFSTTEMMTVAASRMLNNGAVCFVGIGLPSTAANLARLTHSPDVVLIYESGPDRRKTSGAAFVDWRMANSRKPPTRSSQRQKFLIWLQGGRIDVGFLGAAQIDRFANINTTVIGDYDRPKPACPVRVEHRKSPAWHVRC